MYSAHVHLSSDSKYVYFSHMLIFIDSMVSGPLNDSIFNKYRKVFLNIVRCRCHGNIFRYAGTSAFQPEAPNYQLYLATHFRTKGVGVEIIICHDFSAVFRHLI